MTKFIDTKSFPGFTIQVLDNSFVQRKQGRLEELSKLVAECFCQGEPLSRFLGIESEQMDTHFVQHVVEKAVNDEMSLICVENNAQRMVAVMLNEDFHDTLHPDEAMVNELGKNFPQILPILELLDHLDQKLVQKKFDGVETICRNRIFHAFMGATHEDYCGRGLAKKLREITADFARSLEFAYVCVEPTNPITQHIWKKLGATVEYATSTKDFEMSDGTKPFSKFGKCFEQELSIVLLTV